ncbi:hypothetical protein M0R88_10940 [Halorussus gelatinilyticus]|uniref:Ig-like domain-containing protein n=1 Tax=Halorussus gelatinilyticus TaxID=2937524 RepID=A0A8U0IDM3_9EURY|nr:hypothetical protein [Halorussus gelatinilyticus]UPV99042.1 hypothetical protein M0R88_10940 [Halorussus gelatinilyticus]
MNRRTFVSAAALLIFSGCSAPTGRPEYDPESNDLRLENDDDTSHEVTVAVLEDGGERHRRAYALSPGGASYADEPRSHGEYELVVEHDDTVRRRVWRAVSCYRYGVEITASGTAKIDAAVC